MAPDKAPLQEYTIWRATSYNGATREGAGRVGMWNQDEIDAVLQKYEIRGIKRSEERRASKRLGEACTSYLAEPSNNQK